MFYAIRGDAGYSTGERSLLPLVMWLQGGPGASSLFGDFLESGPEKLSVDPANASNWLLSPRTHTWVQYANMLYVDNPVGTGFSYTKHAGGFSTSDEDIATNLVLFLKGFLDKHVEFQNQPFWVMCESYGGKMTAYFGAALLDAKLPIDFKGVALGDGWVDPIGCMQSYGPWMQANGLINAAQSGNLTAVAAGAALALSQGHGDQATNLWGVQQDLYEMYSGGVNVYNTRYYYDYTADNVLSTFLTSAAFIGRLRPGLVPSWVSYGQQGGQVFSYMGKSFMRDGIHQVQKMITAGVQVNIYGGQVDLIVDGLCIQGWLEKLSWRELAKFQSAPRVPFYADDWNNVAGWLQSYKNVHYWQINGAGHMVPLDQPASALLMMKSIVQNSYHPPTVDVKKLPRARLFARRHKRA